MAETILSHHHWDFYMNIHQLVIFWRDEQSRCFTAWHFQPRPQEHATTRAQKILAALAQLSGLQIYGAALDAEPLRFFVDKPAPSRGTDTRLQINLTPSAKSQV